MDTKENRIVCLSTGCITLLLCIATTVTNFLLLVVLYKDPVKCFRKPISIFIASIAVLDFLTGAIVDVGHLRKQVMCIIGEDSPPTPGDFTVIVAFFTVNSSTLTIVAMSTERFVAVVYPHVYRRTVTKKKALYVTLLICLYSFAFAMLQIAPLNLDAYFTTDLLLNTILPITTVFVMYTVIYCALRKQRLKLALSSRIAKTSFSQIEPLQHVQTRQEKLEKQFLLTAFSVVLCMVISFMPYIVTCILERISSDFAENDWFVGLKRFSTPFIMFSSAASPYLYFLRMNQFRNAFKKVFCQDRGELFGVRDQRPAWNTNQSIGIGNGSPCISDNRV